MQFRIPFTNFSIRMETSTGKWTASDGDIGNVLRPSQVTEEKALTLGAVYACVNLYARTMASLPCILYRKGPNGKERATDHHLYGLLHNEPNPNMSSHTFRKTMEASLKLYGNAYAWIEFDKYYRIKALWPLQSNSVVPQRSMRTGELFYDAVLYDGTARRFRAYEMVHIPGLGFDGISGRSPVRQFAETMGLSLDIKKYGRKFFQNGARPAGILKHPGSLSEEAQQRLTKSFERRYSGVDNSSKTMLLEEGMEYQSIGIAPDEAQFLESQKFGVNEIARIYGIPPHMIADLEHSTFSNIEQQDLNFAKHSILPECVNWEQELMRKLLNDAERDAYEIEFNMEGLVRGDMQSRYQAYAIGRQWGFLTADDIREKENMGHVEGGDKTYAPLNMISSELADKYWSAKIQESQNKGVNNNAK
ncbi:MAG: phage portal protein [Phascolarctobacterium sp.]